MREGGKKGNIVKDVGYGARGKKRREREGGGGTMTDAISPKILRRPGPFPSLLSLCWPWIKPFERRQANWRESRRAFAFAIRSRRRRIAKLGMTVSVHRPWRTDGRCVQLIQTGQLFRELDRSRSAVLFVPLFLDPPESGFGKATVLRYHRSTSPTPPPPPPPRETSKATCFISRCRRRSRRPCCRTN